MTTYMRVDDGGELCAQLDLLERVVGSTVKGHLGLALLPEVLIQLAPVVLRIEPCWNEPQQIQVNSMSMQLFSSRPSTLRYGETQINPACICGHSSFDKQAGDEMQPSFKTLSSLDAHLACTGTRGYWFWWAG